LQLRTAVYADVACSRSSRMSLRTILMSTPVDWDISSIVALGFSLRKAMTESTCRSSSLAQSGQTGRDSLLNSFPHLVQLPSGIRLHPLSLSNDIIPDKIGEPDASSLRHGAS